MTKTAPAPADAFNDAATRKGMGLAGLLRTPGSEPTPTPPGVEPAVAEPAAAAVAVAEPAVEEPSKPVAPRRAAPRATKPKLSATVEGETIEARTMRKSVTVQIPIDVWEAWDQLLEGLRLPWRSDAAAAAIRGLLEATDDQILEAVLVETGSDRGLTRQLGARVNTELYAQFTGRLGDLGRLPINAGLTAALRRAIASGGGELRNRVLDERRR